MAIVSVTSTDVGDTETLWGVPADAALNITPISRGIRKYFGSVAVAALGAGDQTIVTITLTFPTKFIYYPRSLTCNFASDDTTSEFEQFGDIAYNGAHAQRYLMDSGGGLAREEITNTAINIYRPTGAWRQWLNVEGGGPTELRLIVSDQSGDASTAGDFFWFVDFWMYDKEQCFNYPVNLFEQLLPATYS